MTQELWQKTDSGRAEINYELTLCPSELSGALILLVEDIPYLLHAIYRGLWMAKQYAPDRITLDLEKLRLLAHDGIIRSRELKP